MGEKTYMIPGSAGGRQHLKSAGLAIYRHIHKTVEGYRYTVWLDPVRFQSGREITKTTTVQWLVWIEMGERVDRAWREKKIVDAHHIVDNLEHHARAVGVELVPGGQADRLGIVEGPPR